MDKEKIQIYIPKTGTKKEIYRNFKGFMFAHIRQIGNGYMTEGIWLGNSEKFEVTKDEFKIITDENNEIIYKVVK